MRPGGDQEASFEYKGVWARALHSDMLRTSAAEESGTAGGMLTKGGCYGSGGLDGGYCRSEGTVERSEGY